MTGWYGVKRMKGEGFEIRGHFLFCYSYLATLNNLGKLFNLSEPWFWLLYNEDNNEYLTFLPGKCVFIQQIFFEYLQCARHCAHGLEDSAKCSTLCCEKIICKKGF